MCFNLDPRNLNGPVHHSKKFTRYAKTRLICLSHRSKRSHGTSTLETRRNPMTIQPSAAILLCKRAWGWGSSPWHPCTNCWWSPLLPLQTLFSALLTGFLEQTWHWAFGPEQRGTRVPIVSTVALFLNHHINYRIMWFDGGQQLEECARRVAEKRVMRIHFSARVRD